jgi:hypothetical protein
MRDLNRSAAARWLSRQPAGEFAPDYNPWPVARLPVMSRGRVGQNGASDDPNCGEDPVDVKLELLLSSASDLRRRQDFGRHRARVRRHVADLSDRRGDLPVIASWSIVWLAIMVLWNRPIPGAQPAQHAVLPRRICTGRHAPGALPIAAFKRRARGQASGGPSVGHCALSKTPIIGPIGTRLPARSPGM